MSFLQELIDRRRGLFTIKVYLVSITACNVGFGDLTSDLASQHPPKGMRPPALTGL